MKKKDLEILLQSLENFRNPKPWLEQYSTPANIAADILFLAYHLGDVEDKTVADLGCGTGIFSIGACLLNARRVIAIDIDREAIDILRDNARKVGCEKIEVRNIDVREFVERVDTVFQNPPFGSQRRHADLPFLEKSLEVGNVVYTLHNAVTEDFLRAKIDELGGKITHRLKFRFSIPHMFKFHRREKVYRDFIMFRIVSQG